MNAPSGKPTRRAARVGLMIGELVLMALFVMLPASAAQAVLQPGEPAPPFSLPATGGARFTLDRATTGTVLLVFTKPGDKYTAPALRALEGMIAKYPPLGQGLRIAVVLSRLDDPGQVKAFQKQAAPQWPVIADENDELYRGYKIIATPTVVIVGDRRTVAAVHPGYDPGLVDDVRLALARARGLTLPEAMTGAPAKPNMALQMGRRMAARGLWEDALKYYGEAGAHGPLPPEAQLELAEIHLEMNHADAALAIVNGLSPEMKREERAQKIVQRAQALKTGGSGKPKPPLIKR